MGKIVSTNFVGRYGLAENEEALISLVDALPAMVWLGDDEGRIRYFSEQFYSFTGLRREDDDGYLYLTVIHPDDRHKQTLAMEAVKARRRIELEIRHRAADGSYRWYLVRAVPLTRASGDVTYIGTNMDIDDRKCAEEAVKESEEEFRTLAELIPQLVSVADARDGRTLYANQQYYDYIGKRRADEDGYLWKQVMHPDDLKVILPQLGQPLDGLWRMEVRYRAANGAYKWHLVRSVVQGTKVFVSATDIDEQKCADEEVRESEARLRTLAEAIPQIVWSADARGNIVFINQRYFEYTGLSVEQSVEGGWQLLIHPDDRQSYLDELRRSLATGETFECTFRLTRAVGVRTKKANEFRRHLCRAVALRGSSGNIIQWFGTWTDIEGPG
jgi:PAS domain S-box-containing protein